MEARETCDRIDVMNVNYRSTNITNFDEEITADEWSWSWTLGENLSQDWRAYTLPCKDCVGGVKLMQWQSRAMGLEWWPIEFKDYKGYDDLSPSESEQFKKQFNIPDICQKNNLLKCPSSQLQSKDETNDKCCETCSDGKEKYYSVPILSNDHCGESCISEKDYYKYKLLEPKITKANTNTPCFDMGYSSYENFSPGLGFKLLIKAIDLDICS